MRVRACVRPNVCPRVCVCVFSVSPSVFKFPLDRETKNLVSADLEETLAWEREAVKVHWSSSPLTTPFTLFTGS